MFRIQSNQTVAQQNKHKLIVLHCGLSDFTVCSQLLFECFIYVYMFKYVIYIYVLHVTRIVSAIYACIYEIYSYRLIRTLLYVIITILRYVLVGVAVFGKCYYFNIFNYFSNYVVTSLFYEFTICLTMLICFYYLYCCITSLYLLLIMF